MRSAASTEGVDAAVTAVAEAEDASILAFDFRDFRAAPPLGGGAWRLVVDEAAYRKAVRVVRGR